MALSKEISTDKLKEQFAQAARAELPFNPVKGEPITGGNLLRLQTAMQTHSWRDTRFVSRAQARANGWTLAAKPVAVEILVRDPVNGSTELQELFNAAYVRGMPSMAEMLAMTNDAMTEMREAEQESLKEDVISIAPVRELERNQGTELPPQGTVGNTQLRGADAAADVAASVEVAALSASGNGVAAGISGGTPPQVARYAVMAPYWLNGLHNFEGLAQAKEINELIRAQNLAHDHAALARLMAVYPKAGGFGIGIVLEEKLLNDQHINANPSEPKTLVGGELVRDSEGMYRPKSGGRPALQDQGTSVVLKSKGAQAYRGAMELALSKGWTAIELNGKKSMLAEAWLEARLMGMNVVNYQPTELDKEKFAARLALESQRKAEQQSAQQATEEVEVRPSTEIQSKISVASETPEAPVQEVPKAPVVSGVATMGATDTAAKNAEPAHRTLQAFGPAKYLFDEKNNQSYFAKLVDQHGEIETIWGLDIERSLAEEGAKVGDAITLVSIGKRPVEVMQRQGDGTYKPVQGERQTWETKIQNQEVAPQQRATVNTGLHVGKVMAIQDGCVVQKTGRDPTKVVRHDLSSLKGVSPVVGENAEINYANGVGTVKTQAQELAHTGGKRGAGR